LDCGLKSPRILWQSVFSFPRNSFTREDHCEAAVWKTAVGARTTVLRFFSFPMI
jgi:hypothetical protein